MSGAHTCSKRLYMRSADMLTRSELLKHQLPAPDMSTSPSGLNQPEKLRDKHPTIYRQNIDTASHTVKCRSLHAFWQPHCALQTARCTAGCVTMTVTDISSAHIKWQLLTLALVAHSWKLARNEERCLQTCCC